MRGGDDRAFELLYRRYQRLIAAYIRGMVKDHGRAEDITQEVFVSALRRMRQTERPIAFKPWIYEIAKNACIDAYRRARRAEEISYEADDRLTPFDRVRLVATGLEPDAAVYAKQELDHLCGAFGGLSDSHHEILVLRELEGLSYKDIGERMGMSRPAVESTLFRARKRLSEEYDELASGARCVRVQAIIARSDTSLGVRDQRRLARHISHCEPCRRLAVGAGVEVPVAAPRRVAQKLAALLPVPAFLRSRRGGGGDEVAGTLSGGGGSWAAHASSLAEALQSGWGKGVAGIAALTIAGAGITTIASPDKREERGTGYRATDAQPMAHGGAASPAVDKPRGGERDAAKRAGAGRRSEDSNRTGARQRSDGKRSRADDDSGNAPAGGGGSSSGGGSSGAGSGGGSTSPVDAPQAPSVPAPTATTPNVQDTTDAVSNTVDGVANTVDGATQPVQSTVPQLPSVQDTVDTVQQTTAPVQNLVDGLPQP